MGTKESNKLIAEFMGSTFKEADYTDYNEDGSIRFTANDDGSKWIVEEYSKPDGLPKNVYWGLFKLGDRLEYHLSWDWLIPVIDKITSDDTYPNYIDHTSSIVYRGGVEINTRFIEVTYDSVMDFIKWHKTIEEDE